MRGFMLEEEARNFAMTKPRPIESESVDVFCPVCDFEWSSTATCDYYEGDNYTVVECVNFVGSSNIRYGNHPKYLGDKSDKYNGYRVGLYQLCPNGCKHPHSNKRQILDSMDEMERLAPVQMWDYGFLLNKLDDVRQVEKDILYELSEFGYKD